MPQRAVFKSITDESWAQMCLLTAQGHHRRVACRIAGISKSTLSRYLQVAVAEAAADSESIGARRLKLLDRAEAADAMTLEELGLKHAKAGNWQAV